MPVFVNPPVPFPSAPAIVVLPLPVTVRRLAPLLTLPPAVKRFAELFVHVSDAPSTMFGFSVTAPAPAWMVMPPAPTVRVLPPLLASVTARVSGEDAAFTVRLAMDMLSPIVVLPGSVGVARLPAEKKTFVVAPGTSGVGVPVLSEAQLLAVEPLEAAQSFGLPLSPPTQKAFASGVAAAICTVIAVAVAVGALTVKLAALKILPSA